MVVGLLLLNLSLLIKMMESIDILKAGICFSIGIVFLVDKIFFFFLFSFLFVSSLFLGLLPYFLSARKIPFEYVEDNFLKFVNNHQDQLPTSIQVRFCVECQTDCARKNLD